MVSPEKIFNHNFSVNEEQKLNEMVENRGKLIKFLKSDFSAKNKEKVKI